MDKAFRFRRLASVVGGAVLAASAAASGQTFTVLHTFVGEEGTTCQAPLIEASDGNFYGTTSQGGVHDAGTFFRIDSAGTFVKLHDFDGAAGSSAEGALYQATNGSLYGTTRLGGDFGFGIVYRMETDGTLNVLHHFAETDDDGGQPYSGVVAGADGTLYGITEVGGSGFFGTAFEIGLEGGLVTLHGFADDGGGFYSQGRLLLASDGNFYGTTTQGGSGLGGTVYRMTPGGDVTFIHEFGLTGGWNPQTGLIEADGYLYGTTTYGGDCSDPSGCGTIFRIDLDGNFTSLHDFQGTDGKTPDSELMRASDGMFYGVTRGGGTFQHGTVYRMDSDGNVATIYHVGVADGQGPGAPLIQGSDGNLYGTTQTSIFRISFGAPAPLFCPNAFVRRDQMAVFLLKTEHGAAFAPPSCIGMFPDVACPSLFADWIENLASEGITAGCGGGDYCPLSPITRGQMAVFLLKTEHGSSYAPPSCAGIFPDVPCGSQFSDWIEELATEGITGGCGGGNFCPGNPVTRAQMAVFLLKIEHGSAYVPPACAGMFGDVACPSLFADWIEQLFAEGITAGCS